MLQLVVERLNNGEITQILSSAKATMKSHVRNMLSKLQGTDRTQTTICAWREPLMSRQPHGRKVISEQPF
jgi:DNA-binding NarL/FixJ family response regulator